MKNLISVIYLLAALTMHSTLANAAIDRDPSSIDKLFAAIDMEQSTDDTIRKTVELQMNQNPKLKPYENELLAFSRKHGSFKANEKALRSLYLKYFTDQEIQDMTAFYLTPTGKKTIAVLPEVTAEAFNIGLENALADMPNFEKELAKKKSQSAK